MLYFPCVTKWKDGSESCVSTKGGSQRGKMRVHKGEQGRIREKEGRKKSDRESVKEIITKRLNLSLKLPM